MTTETTETTISDPSVGAPTDIPPTWHQINWRQAERNVRRLAGNSGRQVGQSESVATLADPLAQWQSPCRATSDENTGKRTPGVDGVTWKTPEQKTAGMYSLQQRGYHPQPLRRIYIPKSNGGKRPLSIPMVRSYCPPYGKLSGLCCQGGSDQPIHPGSTVAYFACVDENLVVSNGAEPACGALR